MRNPDINLINYSACKQVYIATQNKISHKQIKWPIMSLISKQQSIHGKYVKHLAIENDILWYQYNEIIYNILPYKRNFHWYFSHYHFLQGWVVSLLQKYHTKQPETSATKSAHLVNNQGPQTEN